MGKRFKREQRQAPRRAIRVVGIAMTVDQARLSCAVHDISETGARIIFDAEEEIPDRFMLEIDGNAAVRRLCVVVRRRGEREVGVSFLGRGERTQ